MIKATSVAFVVSGFRKSLPAGPPTRGSGEYDRASSKRNKGGLSCVLRRAGTAPGIAPPPADMITLRRTAQLFPRLDPAPLWPALGHLASLAVLLAASWLLAGLLGAFVLPAAAPASQRNSEAPVAAAALVAAPLFAGAAVAAPRAEPASHLQLLGVFASERAAQARAIIRRDGEATPLVVAVGDRIGEQFVVTRIAARRVELQAGSTSSHLELPAAQATPPAPPSSEN